MRFTGLALATSAVVLVACGGGDKAPDSAAQPDAPEAATTTPAASAAYMAPTGEVKEVKMIGSGETFSFDPAAITVKQGDAIKFVAVAGVPHNVQFLPEDVPDDAEAQLAANMPNSDAPLTSPYILDIGGSYTISFAGVKPGTYPFHCTPHSMYNMKGTVTVQ